MHALDDSAGNFIKVIFTQMQNTQAFFARVVHAYAINASINLILYRFRFTF
jgi:hypothetical protein